MYGTKLPISAFIPGVAKADANTTDDIALQLATNMQKAEEMVALIKAARHRLTAHAPNYERVINQKESKPRRKIINRKINYSASLTAAVQAFQHYAKNAIECANQLAALMPVMIAGGNRYDSTVPSYGRKANAILAARFYLQVPALLTKMAESFCTPSERGMSGISDLMNLFSNLNKPEEVHHYNDDLVIPFVTTVSGSDGMAELEAAMDKLNAQAEKSAHVLKLFLDAKARYFAEEWDLPHPSTAEAELHVQNYNEAAVDFEVARWALSNAVDSYWNAYFKADDLFKKTYAMVARSSYNSVARNNMIAIKLQLLRAEKQIVFTRRQHEQSGISCNGVPTNARTEHARQALERAFASIPAQLAMPNLPFLQ